ncbi:6-carboxytetrahydropterin synthase QueD [bacterium]|nr:6-carboxytetrahydropterin synthase QueD [bacterium]
MGAPRYTVYKEQDFAAAHFLREYHGACEQLHGHNYRVRVYATCDELDAEGMVLDFTALKQAIQEVIGRFDHRLLNEIPPFDELNPTLELLARHICDAVAARLDDERVQITECHLWETDRNCVIYRR